MMYTKFSFLLFSIVLLGSHVELGNSFKLDLVKSRNPEENGDHFEGDIIPHVPKMVLTRSGILKADARWPNGEVPYEFEPGYSYFMKMRVENAMDYINSNTNNCIKFVKRTNEKDYIEIKSSTKGCYSYVGRIGGNQTVSLPRTCRVFGTQVHELIHALGFYHEQSRTDRDDYVRVHFENVKPGMEYNFDKYSSNEISGFRVPYDYGSVMHYSSTAFAKGLGETLVPVRPFVSIGQRRGMSSGDIQKIKNMYICH